MYLNTEKQHSNFHMFKLLFPLLESWQLQRRETISSAPSHYEWDVTENVWWYSLCFFKRWSTTVHPEFENLHSSTSTCLYTPSITWELCMCEYIHTFLHIHIVQSGGYLLERRSVVWYPLPALFHELIHSWGAALREGKDVASRQDFILIWLHIRIKGPA